MQATDGVSVNIEAIGYFVAFAAFAWLTYKAYRIDKKNEADLPIDSRRILRPWRGWQMTGRTLATITRVELRPPSVALTTFGPWYVSAPWNVEIYFDYLAGDVKRSGKFRVLAPRDLWQSELARLKEIHGESVLVRFDPARPEDCEPVENKWHGWRIWTAGA